MVIVNKAGEALNLGLASKGGDSSHWEQAPPTQIGPQTTATISSYAASDASIRVTYQGADSNALFQLYAETPLVGDNKSSGSTNAANYSLGWTTGSGYHPTDTFTIQPGGTFAYTGATQQFVVPPGITSLQVTAVGGGSDAGYGSLGATGATVTGDMSVTAGQTLTIAVGGNGQGYVIAGKKSYVSGGWGLPANGSSYSGGNGLFNPQYPANVASGGGGATVLLDDSGQVAVVAGGSGGTGIATCEPYGGNPGGLGGYDGSWTGQNGQPSGSGGQAGGAPGTAGAPGAAATGACSSGGSGGGGGGVNGGSAATTGTAGGGGAGSSNAPGLTGATVSNLPTTPGQLVIGPSTT